MPKTTTEISFDDWQRIKITFLTYCFSVEEAEWAANGNLDPEGDKADQIARLLRNRNRRVKIMMRVSGFSRKEVIDDCDTMRRENVERKGGEDIMNLFIGESP